MNSGSTNSVSGGVINSRMSMSSYRLSDIYAITPPPSGAFLAFSRFFLSGTTSLTLQNSNLTFTNTSTSPCFYSVSFTLPYNATYINEQYVITIELRRVNNSVIARSRIVKEATGESIDFMSVLLQFPVTLNPNEGFKIFLDYSTNIYIETIDVLPVLNIIEMQ